MRPHSKIVLINPRNQGGLRYLFDLNDPQSNPENIDMNAIQPVIDMTFGGWARFNDTAQYQGKVRSADSIAGIQTKSYRIATYGNASGADPQIVVPVGSNFLVWGMKYHVVFNAAGAAALAGQYVASEISFGLPDGTTSLVRWTDQWEINGNIELYNPGFSRVTAPNNIRPFIIPASTYVDLTIWIQDGTLTFPAGTTVVYMIFGQAVPIGAPIPPLF